MIAMNRLRHGAGSAALAASLLGALLGGVPGTAAAQAGGVPVATATAEIQPVVNVVKLSGTVVAPRTARVSTAVGGLVARVAVDLGDRVEVGATLVELDAALARHEVARARAAVDEAEAELADARRRLGVAERLVKRGNMPQNELDARAAQVDIAAAALTRLEAEAAHARERLNRHTVKAPFAGVVARKASEAGEWLSPGTTVVELVATEGLRVDIPVPQKYYPELRAGSPVDLRFDALPGKAFEAQRVALVPVSDPTARTFTLRVRPVADDIPLTPGMSAQASMHLATGERGVVIPRDAVIRYPDGRTSVWVVEGSGENVSVSERQLRLGRAFDGRVHVLAGLEAGQRVVVRGNESLRQGQPVRITDEAS